MKRGEIWTLRDNNYASKSRPAIIVQAELEDTFDSIVLCLMTTYNSEFLKTRVRIEPEKSNGLNKTTFVMTEKIVFGKKGITWRICRKIDGGSNAQYFETVG